MDKSTTPAAPDFCTVKSWCERTGMSNSSFYELLKEGHLKAVKLGGRTLVDCAHGLAYLPALPPVQSRPARTRSM